MAIAAAQDALGKGLMEQYQRLSSMDQMEQMKELAKEFTDVVPVPLADACAGRRLVDSNGPLVSVARATGICFGDET